MSVLIMNKSRKKLIFSSIIAVVFLTVLFFSASSLGQSKSSKYVSRFNIQQWEVVPSDATLEEILKIETSVVFPDDTYSMDSYLRFYAVGEHEGEKILYAVFTHKGLGKYWDFDKYKSLAPDIEGAFFVRGGGLPIVADGGCGIINISYNLAEPLKENEEIIVTGPPDWRGTSRVSGQCNGLA